MKTKKPVVEQKMLDDLKELVNRQIRAYQRSSVENTPVAGLEKLAKTYSILAACIREDLKSGVFSEMTDEQLEELASDEHTDKLVDTKK